MKSLFIALSSAAFIVSPASAQTGRSTAPIFAEGEQNAAMKEVMFCGGTSEDPDPPSCKSRWRNISWSTSPSGMGEIKPDNGTAWLYRCTYDEIEDEERCLFMTGDQFALSFEGTRVWMNWGTQRFPGSEMIVRFDDEGPMSTKAKDGWTLAQGTSMFRKMMGGKTMRYRWFDWPEDSARDGRIDLNGFADVGVLMKAIFWDFRSKSIERKFE